MPFFGYDDSQIYYEEHGKGTPVIFCHGNTASSRMFSLLMPLYEDDLHCNSSTFSAVAGPTGLHRFHPTSGSTRQGRLSLLLSIWNWSKSLS